MTALWLSRAHLRRDTAAVAALSRLLVPEDGHARIAAAHRLVWALFADTPDRRRDFLWREEAPGRFMTLSARAPDGELELFEVEARPFEPALVEGDRLTFTLRANPVVSRPAEAGRRGIRHDVVMDALRRLPEGERATRRLDVAREAGLAWLRRQGETHGFAPSDDVGVDGYEPVHLRRDDAASGRHASIRFSRLEFTGRLTVTDPARFVPRLGLGFGHARAFGCGLMLIRRA